MLPWRGTLLVPTTYIHEFIMKHDKSLGYADGYPAKECIAGEQEVKVFRRAAELGVRIAFRTDAVVCPHGENAGQFATCVEHGITPLAAVQSATIHAAELLGSADHAGSIELGKWAGLITVRENPLEDVRVLEHVGFVMKDGRVCKDRLH